MTKGEDGVIRLNHLTILKYQAAQAPRAIGAGFEGELGYARVRTRMVGDWLLESNDNVFKATLRYNFSKNFDASLAYSFQDDIVGGDNFGLSVGYSF